MSGNFDNNNRTLDLIEQMFKKKCEQALTYSQTSSCFEHKNNKKIEELYRLLLTQPNSLKSLSLPKRIKIDAVNEIQNLFCGNIGTVIDIMLESKIDTSEIVAELFKTEDYLINLSSANISKTSLESFIIRRRFEIEKGVIFTLRHNLNLMLYDTDIGKDLPVGLIRPPFNACYIEFGEPENRADCKMKMYAFGKQLITEGAYVINYPAVNLKNYSQEMIEDLMLDRNKPARKIEICFTGSPIDNDNNSIMSDFSDIVCLFIQDETEPVQDVLDRHFNFSSMRNKNELRTITGSPFIDNDFITMTTKNIYHLIKAMAHIGSNHAVSLVEKEYSELVSKISRVADKKKKKYQNMLVRKYDRILIGPKKKYVPLSTTLRNIKDATGVEPHLRRSFWGIRWTGKGRGIPEIRWTKPALVNADKIKDGDILLKDYFVF